MDGQKVEARLKALFQIAHSLSSSMDVNQLLALIIAKSQEVANAEGASLLLRVPGTDLLEFVNVTGHASGFLRAKRIAFGEGISGEVARTKTIMNIPDAYLEPRFNDSFDKASGFKTREILAIPMINLGQIIGVLSVINNKTQKPFEAEDESILGLFSDQASVALVRALERKRSDMRAQSLKVLTKETARILSNELTLTYAHCHRLRKDVDRIAAQGAVTTLSTEAIGDPDTIGEFRTVETLRLSTQNSICGIERSTDSLARISKTLQAHSHGAESEDQTESYTFQNASRLLIKQTHFPNVGVYFSPKSSNKVFKIPLESVILSLESLLESLARRCLLNQLPPHSTVVIFREREGFLDFCVATCPELMESLPPAMSSSQNLLSLANVSALVDSLGGELLTMDALQDSQSRPLDLSALQGINRSFQAQNPLRIVYQIVMPLQGAE